MDMIKRAHTVGSVQFVQQTPRIRDEEQYYELDIQSSFKKEFLVYLAEYWRGILSGYGLVVVDSKITELGAARMTFVSRGKLTKAEPQMIK